MPAIHPEVFANEQFCYLTTLGRISGRPHTIEIWFALHGATLYMLAGNGENSDWVRNARKDPHVTIRLGDIQYPATPRFPDPCSDEDIKARRLVGSKYGYWTEGEPFTGWAAESLSVVYDLDIDQAMEAAS